MPGEGALNGPIAAWVNAVVRANARCKARRLLRVARAAPCEYKKRDGGDEESALHGFIL